MLHKFSILHMGMHLKNYSVELLVFFVRGYKNYIIKSQWYVSSPSVITQRVAPKL